MTIILYIGASLLVLVVASLTPPGVASRRWLMAKGYARIQAKYEVYIAERKRELFAGLTGTVLELGPGPGVNFPYLPSTITRWIGLEPNTHMHAQLRDAAERCGVTAEFREIGAEQMDVEDDSVDCVLCTLVLCSLGDPESVLRDVFRVLKPGGRFVFVEHVAAPRGTRLRQLQRLVKPFWWYFADCCRPDRETERLIRDFGFADVTLEEFRVPKSAISAVVSPQIAGSATK